MMDFFFFVLVVIWQYLVDFGRLVGGWSIYCSLSMFPPFFVLVVPWLWMSCARCVSKLFLEVFQFFLSCVDRVSVWILVVLGRCQNCVWLCLRYLIMLRSWFPINLLNCVYIFWVYFAATFMFRLYIGDILVVCYFASFVCCAAPWCCFFWPPCVLESRFCNVCVAISLVDIRVIPCVWSPWFLVVSLRCPFGFSVVAWFYACCVWLVYWFFVRDYLVVTCVMFSLFFHDCPL